MSVPEYTVRMASHKCDRDARRAIIAAICDRDPISATRPHATTRTRLLYEGVAAVNLIDCDYDVLDEKLTDHDIIYVDFSKATPKYKKVEYEDKNYPNTVLKCGCIAYDGLDDQNEYKQQWVQKILTDTGTTLWETPHGHIQTRFYDNRVGCRLGGSGHVIHTPVKLVPDSTPIYATTNKKATWWKFIDDIFGIKGLQSVESYLEPYCVRSVPGISTQVAPIRGNTPFDAPGTVDAPWPVPEMTINLPPFVKVEEIRHDPATNAITIKFG